MFINVLSFLINMKSKTIALIATLDTKGKEAQFIKKVISSRGHDVIIIDTGLLGNLFLKEIFLEKKLQNMVEKTFTA